MNRTFAAAGLLGLSAVLIPMTAAHAVAPTPNASFGGYQVNGSAVTSVSAVLVVPKAKCTTTNEAMQNGIVYNGQTTIGGIFTSSSYSAVTVWTTCQAVGRKKVAEDKVVIFVNNSQAKKTLPVVAGQKISMSIAYNAKKGKIAVKAEDLKTKKKLGKTAPVLSFVSISAQAGIQPLDDSTDTPLPVPSFTKDSFSGVLISGMPLGKSAPVGNVWTRGKAVLATPSAIKPAGSFHLTFGHH